eukprot:TRINITY_DN46079_c0_g1_i1.p1 TRINITY_DN46079_c0_g1~~TRINITY_DN46079_c0_g1_i1.p1  ORF type:complete len:415 (-),score=59.73 TRINITY_DN46079_c0_g1_i1:93-1337(-)
MAEDLVPDLEEFRDRHGIDDRCFEGLKALPPSSQVVVMFSVDSKESFTNASAVTWSLVRKMQSSPAPLTLEYLRRNIDERCLESLKQLSQPEQEYVATQVDVSKCRNLSARVFSSIKSTKERRNTIAQQPVVFATIPQLPAQHMQQYVAQIAGVPGGMPVAYQLVGPAAAAAARNRSRTPPPMVHALPLPGPPVAAPSSAPVDPAQQLLLLQSQLDDRASKSFAELSEEEQFIVAGLVAKKGARNPSAVAWSQIKFVREQGPRAKHEYILGCLDANAAAGLQKLPEEEQEAVLEQVHVGACRNISAFVWSKIKSAVGTSAPVPSAAPRTMMVPMVPQAMMAPQAMRVAQPSRAPSTRVNGAMQQVKNQLDERVRAAFDQLSAREQSEVLSQVDLAVCRNPSAFVWSKIKGLGKA